MPGDKRRPKCNWERERRERLNVSFYKLSKLLPDHDPTLTLPKIEIITKATEYIQQLKNENMQLVVDSDNITGAQKNEVNHLKQRVTDLLRRTRQLADLLQAADIPIPSEVPPHESEFPLKRPSKWSGRINKDTAKEILENIKKKRDEKETIRKEKQKFSKEKKNNNLTKQKKSKSKTILTSVKVSSEKRCPVTDMLGLTTSTSNMSTPLREINNALPDKTLTYPKTLTVPCTTISLVISNTKTSIVSVAKSNILTAPIMATGIQPVLERNPALSNLGPGTLILPDGRIMPVPPPAPTVLTAATQFIVNRSTQPAVIVMPNNVTSIKQGKTQRVLVPKPKTKDSTKTTFVNKVPIPAIKTYDTRTYIKNNTDQLSLIVNNKKQKLSVKDKKVKSKSSVELSESTLKTNKNIKNKAINTDELNKQQHIAVNIISDHKNNEKSKKRTRNISESVSCKKLKLTVKSKIMDKLDSVNNKVEGSIRNNQAVSNQSIDQDVKHNKEETDNLNSHNNDVELKKLPGDKGGQLDQNDITDIGSTSQTNTSQKSQIDNTDSRNSNTSKINQTLIHETTESGFVNSIEIPYHESVSKHVTESSSEANSDIMNTAVSCVNTLDPISCTGQPTVNASFCSKSTKNDNKAVTNTNSFNSEFDTAVHSESLNHSSFENKNKQNSVSHKFFNSGEISGNNPVGDLALQIPVNSNILSTTQMHNQISASQKTVLSCPVKAGNQLDQSVTNFIGNKVDSTLRQNILDNSFSIQTDQKASLGVVNSSTNQISYLQQQTNVDVRGVMSTHRNQNTLHKVVEGSLVGQTNDIRNSLVQTQGDNSQNTNMNCSINVTDHAVYQLSSNVHSGNTNSQLYQTTTDTGSVVANPKHKVKENFVLQTMDSSTNTGYSIHQTNPNSGAKCNIVNTQNEQTDDGSKNNLNIQSSQQTNVNIRRSIVNATKSLTDPSVYQTSIDFRVSDGSKNTENDSVRQTNINPTGAVGNSTQSDKPIQHTSTDYRNHTAVPKNSLNDHSVQGSIIIGAVNNSRNMQGDQMSSDFKYPVNSKTTLTDHFNHQHRTNTNRTINAQHNNSVHQHRVDLRGATNSSKNILNNTYFSQASVDSRTMNSSATIKNDMSNTTLHSVLNNNIHQVMDQVSTLSSSANTLNNNNSSVNKPPTDVRCTANTSNQASVDFRGHAFNIDSNHSIHQGNRMSVATFTSTQTDKTLLQSNPDYRNLSLKNDHLVCQTNMDFRGTSSNTQTSSVCHTNTSVSKIINQTSMDFRSTTGISVNEHQTTVDVRGTLATSVSVKNDSVCQISTNFSVPINNSITTHRNQCLPSEIIDMKESVGVSKNIHNDHVLDGNLDFRSSIYTSTSIQNSIHQPNMDTRNSFNSRNIRSGENFNQQMNMSIKGSATDQSSVPFRSPAFSSSNNSIHSTNMNDNGINISKQTQIEKTTQNVNEVVSSKTSINHPIGQTIKDNKCITNSHYTQPDQTSIKDVNVAVTDSQNVQSARHKTSQIGKDSKLSIPSEQKNTSSGNCMNIPTNQQMSAKDNSKDYADLHTRVKNVHHEKERTKNMLNNNSFNVDNSNNAKLKCFSDKNSAVGGKMTKEQQIQHFNEVKTKDNQKLECNVKKTGHAEILTESMKLQTCTENVFRDLNYRERNTFIPINHCMDEMRLTLSNTDFSNDLFSSLQVPSGGQHPESISPTAAFLLAFPLVSTSKTSEMLAENENSDSQHATPTTILQIGNIDPPGSELYQSVENTLQYQNSVKTKHDDKVCKQLKPVDNFGKFQEFEIQNDRVSQNYTQFRIDDSFSKNSCKQKKSNFMMLQDQELFLPCDKKSNTVKNCPYLSQSTSGNFANVEFQTRNAENQNIQQNNSTNQPMANQKKRNSSSNAPNSQYSYNQPYYNLFSSNNDFPASVTSNFTTTQSSSESQKPTTQNSNQNNFSSVLSWTMPMTTASTSHHEYTTPYTTFSQKTQPYLNQTNAKPNQLQNFERKDKQNSALPKFSTNFQFGNNARSDILQYHNNGNQLNFKDSKSKKSKTNPPRPPVNWMTTPDIRPVLPDHMSAILPDVMFPTKDLDLIPPQNTILNSCSNIPPFNIPTSIPNNQTFYPNSHFSGIDLPLDLPPFPEIATSKQNRSNQQSSQYSWSPNKTTIPLLPHLDNHTLAIPSTLPTLVGDLALGTNTGPPTPAENFKSYTLPNNFTGNTVKRCDTKQAECPKNPNKLPDKDCLVTTNNERRNTTTTDYCKTHSNQSTNTSGSFLSVSQLVDQVKSDRNVQRRSTKQVVGKPANTQKRSNVPTDKHNMKNVPLNNYQSNNAGAVQQRKSDSHFTDERNKTLGYPGIFPSGNMPPSWQAGKNNTNAVQFKGGSYSAESLIGVNSETNVMSHDNLPEISQFPSSNQFPNQYNTAVSTNNTYNADFSQNIQHGTEYTQTQQPYQNCFNFTSQNSIYTSTTTAPFMESDYQLSLDSSYVFHHPSTNTTCQANQVKDRPVQSTKRNATNKRRDDYTPLPINQPATTFMQTSQMYPPNSQYVNTRNSSTYQPISSCASGSNTTSSLAHHGTTTLTNFNLSTIFPEINDKRAVPGSNTYHTNSSKHDVNTSVAQPGVRSEYSVTTDSVDNRLPSIRPGFNNILLTQQAGAPLNPPPSSHFTTEGFSNVSSTAGGFSVH